MIPTFQREVIKAALLKMFSQSYFDICTIDNILRLTGGVPDRDTYNALRVLHCVHYTEMSHQLRIDLPKMVQVVIEARPLHFELSAPVQVETVGLLGDS